MPYLLQMSFDNSKRLAKKQYCFEYRGRQFKLVQDNPRKWADHLLTIAADFDGPTREKAFTTAAEFLSALAWENGSRVAIWESGALSCPYDYSLKVAKPNMFSPPRIAHGGTVLGYDLLSIPNIETEAQRVALALFREANSSNNVYLSFLFFWQVLESGGGEPIGFINKSYRKDRSKLRFGTEQVSRLPINGRSLGSYLLDDCRHAIAHIRRHPGKTRLDVDNPSERLRLTISAAVIKAFAEHYIRERLGLKNKLFLAYRKRGEIPVYIDRRSAEASSCRPVFPVNWQNRRLLFKSRKVAKS